MIYILLNKDALESYLYILMYACARSSKFSKSDESTIIIKTL